MILLLEGQSLQIMRATSYRSAAMKSLLNLAVRPDVPSILIQRSLPRKDPG